MVLRIRDLSLNLDDFSLGDINLRVKREYFILLGHSGAGKTLLLECISGLYSIDMGGIFLNGEEITRLPPEERNIGYVPQDYCLFPNLNVRENIEFSFRVKGISSENEVEEIMDLLNISDLENRSVETLSGGEKQRVALARALVYCPKILLLDEPLSALDLRTREMLQYELRRIHKEIKIPIIHVTHNLDEAIGLGDRIAVMHDGRIIQIGSPDKVFKKPSSEFVANLITNENLLSGISAVREGIAEIDVNGIKIYGITEKEGDVHVFIPPEDILLHKKRPESSARNVFKGRIVSVADKGILVHIRIDLGIILKAIITKRSYLEMKLDKDSDVFVSFKATNVHLF